jgi:RNA polymerase sigma-70 factor (ECF subfamily)
MTKKLLPFRRLEQRDVSDEALVSGCAAGDGAALEELFRRHGEQVHRVLVRLRHIELHDVDDVVQTTFLEVCRSAKRFRGGAAVSTWILGIAMNVARHYVRGEMRRHSAMAGIASVSLPTDDRRPDDWVSQRQSLERMKAGFDGLPRDFQVIFTLCDLEGLKGVEVAVALGIPEGTVWRRLHEARIRLRASIQEQVRS